MNNFNITLVQTSLTWQQSSENCRSISERLDAHLSEQKTDLIVLPEMFNSGFTMNPEKVAESMDGETVDWLKTQARKFDAAITGSIVIHSEGKNFNRMLFVTPDGNVEHYDKRHLFRMADEHQRYSEGNEKKMVNWRGWRIALFVCYDLRFPVWCRQKNDADLMLFIASWPAARAHPWITLLKARAIENLCYVAGVNRIGTDANDIAYQGDSAVYDMKGLPVVDLLDKDEISTQTLDANALIQFREVFPAHLDADDFSLKID